MSPPVELQDLIAEIAHQYPTAQIDYDPMPSGVCFLWVTQGGRQFAFEYHPEQGVGVSENKMDTPPFVGHDRVFASSAEAVQYFLTLLSEAARPLAEPAFAGR